ncbi:thioredoxin fold domain-containing protein [Myroides sp. LJL115]
MRFFLSMVLFWNSFYAPFDLQIKDNSPKTHENTIIFFTASWCSYCLLMDTKIWKDPIVMEYIKQNYNFISLKELSRDLYSMSVNEVLYTSNSTNWPAQVFSFIQQFNKEALYPTIVIINKNNQIIYRHPGYIKKKELERVFSIIEHKHR